MTRLKYTAEIKERAVRLLLESEQDYPSTWAAITAIAPKIGCTPETLRAWHQKHKQLQNPAVVQLLSDQQLIKQLERENKKSYNEPMKFFVRQLLFAQAELGRPYK